MMCRKPRGSVDEATSILPVGSTREAHEPRKGAPLHVMGRLIGPAILDLVPEHSLDELPQAVARPWPIKPAFMVVAGKPPGDV